jgi:hypothetical protein
MGRELRGQHLFLIAIITLEGIIIRDFIRIDHQAELPGRKNLIYALLDEKLDALYAVYVGDIEQQIVPLAPQIFSPGFHRHEGELANYLEVIHIKVQIVLLVVLSDIG